MPASLHHMCGSGGSGGAPAGTGLPRARSGHAPIHRLDRCASLPVLPTARPSAGLAGFSGSARAACRTGPAGPLRLRLPTRLLRGSPGPSPVIVGHGDFPMHPKAEKLALFRYGLIAPLVLEPLPRGELTRRAEDIVPASTTSPIPNAAPSPSIPCSIGRRG